VLPDIDSAATSGLSTNGYKTPAASGNAITFVVHRPPKILVHREQLETHGLRFDRLPVGVFPPTAIS
jgi:hypothetical protein